MPPKNRQRPTRRPSRLRLEQIRFYGACEGSCDFGYLNRLKYLINEATDEYFVHFDFDETNGGSRLSIAKKAVVKRAKKNRIYALMDYELDDIDFKNAVMHCNNYGINFAYTNICLELWLILHKEYYDKQVASQDDYRKIIRRLYGLHPTAKIKEKKNREKIFDSISLEDVKTAITRARKIEKINRGTKKEFSLNERYTYFADNPSLNIHEFVEQVLKEVQIIEDDCND